jgi:hypothetical protein
VEAAEVLEVEVEGALRVVADEVVHGVVVLLREEAAADLVAVIVVAAVVDSEAVTVDSEAEAEVVGEVVSVRGEEVAVDSEGRSMSRLSWCGLRFHATTLDLILLRSADPSLCSGASRFFDGAWLISHVYMYIIIMISRSYWSSRIYCTAFETYLPFPCFA